MKKSSCCQHLFQFLLSFTVFALSCVSIATSHWRQSSSINKQDGSRSSDTDEHLIVSGLWKTCNASREANSYECFVGEDTVGMQMWLKVCRMGAVLRLVTSLLIVSFSLLFARRPTRIKSYTITGLQFSGAFAFILTLILYSVEFNDQTKHVLTGITRYVVSFQLGWSYILGWVSVLLTLVNIVFTIVVFQNAVKLRTKKLQRMRDAKRLMKNNCYYVSMEELEEEGYVL